MPRSAPLEGVPKTVGKRTQGALGSRFRPCGVLLELRTLFLIRYGLPAEANPAARWIDLQHHYLHLAADGECLHDIRVAVEAGFGKGHQAGAPGREKDEHAELFVTLDLAGDDSSRRN